MAQKQFHSKAGQFLYNRYIAGDSRREAQYEEEVINAEIARKIYQICAVSVARYARQYSYSAVHGFISGSWHH